MVLRVIQSIQPMPLVARAELQVQDLHKAVTIIGLSLTTRSEAMVGRTIAAAVVAMEAEVSTTVTAALAQWVLFVAAMKTA